MKKRAVELERDPYEWIVHDNGVSADDAGVSEDPSARDDKAKEHRASLEEISVNPDVWTATSTQLKEARKVLRVAGQVEERHRDEAYGVVCAAVRIEVRLFLRMRKDDDETWVLPPFESLTYLPMIRPGVVAENAQYQFKYYPLCQSSPEVTAPLGCTSMALVAASSFAYLTKPEQILPIDGCRLKIDRMMKQAATVHWRAVAVHGKGDKFMNVTDLLAIPYVAKLVGNAEVVPNNAGDQVFIIRQLRSMFGYCRMEGPATTASACGTPDLPLALRYMRIMSRRLRLPVVGVFTSEHRSICIWTARPDVSKDKNKWIVFDSHSARDAPGHSTFYYFHDVWDFLDIFAPGVHAMYQTTYTLDVFVRMHDDLDKTYDRSKRVLVRK